MAECRALVQRMLPGYDYSREILLTGELALGDTVLLYHGDRIIGFALAHTSPLVEGRTREELRVLKLGAGGRVAVRQSHSTPSLILLGGVGHAGWPCASRASSSSRFGG